MSSIENVQNLHPDPRCLRVRDMWRATSTIVGEKHRYTLAEGAPSGSVFVWTGLPRETMRGNVLYVRVSAESQAVLDNLSIENCSLVARGDGWIAGGAGGGSNANYTLWVTNGPFTLQEVGCYSPEDWKQLYAAYEAGRIQFPWVAGPRDATTAGQVGPWEL